MALGDCIATLERFEHVNGNIGDHHFVLVDTLALHAVVDHHVAERARRSDAAGAGCEELL